MTREIDLSRFPRFPLLDAGATPIKPLDNLNRRLAGEGHRVRIFVKRDDLIPIGGGGNKMRKLEFLIGDAVPQGADTIVTFGGRQSNHARQTAAAAARAGLACELVLSRVVPRDDDPDYDANGNVLLDAIFGARLHDVPPGGDAQAAARERVAALEAEGHRVYVAPAGGSSAVGCLGYVGCASEIALQCDHHEIDFAQIVVAGGSNGTQAGLVSGFAAMGSDPKLVKSYTVLAPLEAARAEVLEKAQATAHLIDPALAVTPDMIVVDGAHRGEGYGIPTEGMRDAVELIARTEGLLLDPVYSGKAFAGLLHDIRAGSYADGASVLFIMTGGTPGLFAYRRAFT
ncbi:D-cysteine desulfhydrase [Beijerinckiaceae bacterium RH CH11]|nr:D-cysteine desulfhydrase family protein [Beijerinckiaceae bacterium]VVB48005.1 D-cysteine desulfhydrase [Beijerinckiaceae bacterium RH CH11]VVB48082.1 D-cysteine desulfhydrase [Beijerinckiaceae bacterium RH AL8]